MVMMGVIQAAQGHHGLALPDRARRGHHVPQVAGTVLAAVTVDQGFGAEIPVNFRLVLHHFFPSLILTGFGRLGQGLGRGFGPAAPAPAPAAAGEHQAPQTGHGAQIAHRGLGQP